MRDANIVLLTGNLARDPEIRYTASNMAVANFTIAANRGEYNGVDKGADFIPITAWGKTAEAIEKYLRKGDKVLVRGSIHIDAYESAGQKRYKTYVSAEQIQFLKTKQNTIPGETLEGPAFVRQEDQDTVDIPF
jgi:single-strand DNA-binding protein